MQTWYTDSLKIHTSKNTNLNCTESSNNLSVFHYSMILNRSEEYLRTYKDAMWNNVNISHGQSFARELRFEHSYTGFLLSKLTRICNSSHPYWRVHERITSQGSEYDHPRPPALEPSHWCAPSPEQFKCNSLWCEAKQMSLLHKRRFLKTLSHTHG